MNRLQRLFFNLWYYLKPPWDTQISPPELLEFIAQHPPARALDLGCGTGTNVITLAQHGWQATGVDFAPKAIHIARRKAHQAGVSADFWVEDVTRLQRPQPPFDLILDMGCYHGLSRRDQQKYITNVDRLLAPSGHFLLYVFFRGHESAPRPGVVEADLEQITSRWKLINRRDSTERGIRPAVWLLLQKPAK